MQFEELAKTFAKKDLPDSEVELSGSIPAEDIAAYRAQALAHVAEHLSLPGFRPGKVPPDVALKQVGEMAVLEEAVELFVKDFYPELIGALNIDAVGRPDIRVTKLAPQNPVELAIRATVYPDVTLPKDWNKTGDSVALEPSLPATGEEVAKTLEDLRQSRKKDGIVPELSDEFATSIGAFDSLEHLKAQIHKGIGEEKARQAHDVRRGKIIEALLGKSNIPVPRLFVESELEKILSQMREDVARFGMSFDDYLKQGGKTEEAIRNDFKEQAAKRAKLQMLLNKIAVDEKLEVDQTAVEAELKHALGHFPDATPALVRIHIETVLRNELALKLLEGEVKNEPVK